MSRNRDSSLSENIVRLFEELASVLPAECATLRIEHTSEAKRKLVTVRLTPNDSACAQIVVHVQEGCPNVYLWAGRHTPFEMMIGYEDKTIPDVRKICTAIIDGKFEEEFWSAGSEITKCIGNIELDGKVRTMRYYGGFYPFRKKERKRIKYAPYCPGANRSAL